MIFQTRDEWEVSDPIYKLLTGDSGVHRYPIVKISLNFNLFHLEICNEVENEGVKIWERYIFGFIQDIIGILSEKQFHKIKISLQPACKLGSRDDSLITRITEIVELDANGQKSYIYKCNDGNTYNDTHNTECEQSSTELKVIYCDYT